MRFSKSSFHSAEAEPSPLLPEPEPLLTEEDVEGRGRPAGVVVLDAFPDLCFEETETLRLCGSGRSLFCGRGKVNEETERTASQ